MISPAMSVTEASRRSSARAATKPSSSATAPAPSAAISGVHASARAASSAADIRTATTRLMPPGSSAPSARSAGSPGARSVAKPRRAAGAPGMRPASVWPSAVCTSTNSSESRRTDTRAASSSASGPVAR